MMAFESPSPRDGDEDRYEERFADGLCEICAARPGELAQDGDWVCPVCASALETAHPDAVAGGREQR